MIIYTVPNDSVQSIWTKAGLISIREFERKILGEKDYKNTCIATPAPGGAVDTVVCEDSESLLTPLSLFTIQGKNPNNLENMTEQEIKDVL